MYIPLENVVKGKGVYWFGKGGMGGGFFLLEKGERVDLPLEKEVRNKGL